MVLFFGFHPAASASAQLHSLGEELVTLRESLSKRDTEMETLKSRFTSLQMRLRDKEKAVQEKVVLVAELEGQVQELRKRHTSGQGIVRHTQEENDRLQRTVTAARQARADMEKELQESHRLEEESKERLKSWTASMQDLWTNLSVIRETMTQQQLVHRDSGAPETVDVDGEEKGAEVKGQSSANVPGVETDSPEVLSRMVLETVNMVRRFLFCL